MKPLLSLLFSAWLVLALTPVLAAQANTGSGSPEPVTVSETVLTIPTYQSPGRDMNPPLFENSTLSGLYPFTTYRMPFKPGGPVPQKYPAVVVENQYLKLTYIPEFGGRFFSLYDKLRHRQVLYHNDVIKPAGYNKRDNFPLFGIELTGPFDAHSRTLHGEPYWSHTILRHKDGSVSVVLGEVDPVYHMDVTFTATLYPGVAAMKTSVFCYNPNDGEKPQMFWTSAAMHSTPRTRFLYPMTRTVGHTTGEIASWPVYNGVDYSWDQNNKNMLGVFGIDTYDNFGGVYKFDKNYGLFRYADRRVVQGMKLWTFGYSPLATLLEKAYTDHAGPYIEIQSGRMLWDGYYEYVRPHQVESWHEWWIPVAGIDGLTTLAPDVALNLQLHNDATGRPSSITVALSPVRTNRNATLVVTAKRGELLRTTVNLTPGTPVKKEIAPLPENAGALQQLEVRITASDGKSLLDYHRPDSNPGGHDSPYATGLTESPVPIEKMTAEQATIAAELKAKEMKLGAATDLANVALKRDPGYSPAHRLLGMLAFSEGHFPQAAAEFQKAVDRDPYDSESWYYLSVCQLRLDQPKLAENDLYYIWPGSAFYGVREYQLGRLAFLRHDNRSAAQHLRGAIQSNGEDLQARLLLALVYRGENKRPEALRQLAKVTAINPANRIAEAEKFFLTGNPEAEKNLRDLMGGQGEDAIQVSIFYSNLDRWKDAKTVLEMVQPPHNKDPWGISPVYEYTLAYAQKRSGDLAAAAESRKRAQAAGAIVERFPYRAETLAPLEDAVEADPNDTVARFNLACLLYFRGNKAKAIEQWTAVNKIDSSNFGSRRALGLAYAADGKLTEAIPEMQVAVRLQPDDMDTLDDLGNIYARSGKFEEQIALIQSAYNRDPSNDHLAEGLLNANLIVGRYAAAQDIIDHHTFAPRHRTYTVRGEYRDLKYGMGTVAFNKGQYQDALKLFESALTPPVSLGVDNFTDQSTPRIHYAIGRTLEALGKKQEAQKAYEQSAAGADQLLGGVGTLTSENFYMLLSLDRLGRHQEAVTLMKQFKVVADSRVDSPDPSRRAAAYYLLGLIDQYHGRSQQSRAMMEKAVAIRSDFIGPRYELRGDAIRPSRD